MAEIWDLYDRDGNRTGETWVRGFGNFKDIPEERYHLGVDILDIAIDKLQVNADELGVSDCIHGFVDTIEHYPITIGTYDLIIAVSALEHVESKEIFWNKLREIRDGIKTDGIVCLVINSDVREKNKETLEDLEPQFEVNLSTKELQSCIDDIFSEWDTIKRTVSYQEYYIPRDVITSHLTTNVVTYVGIYAGY
ncbi:MAG: class I SAM-dependent methyltransferase [Butyrivibrio sp.]|uniref:class I SAM-dependent methyltransferase n=1 Tax=Butyrivibrio sp. TaxID=28121 RepID=UPI0025ECA431|nr:class I SAM-dependent methyltransferase [Butyrivibrio sp.]MCR5771004.1 class I SAM-dependent methyltransferase [Butyrivibrio sp.]